MDSTFEKYAIVQYLKCHAPTFYATIDQLYTICQNLLIEIPKTFSNYTIHDIGHSIRVIGYMDTLVKDRVEQFSALHLMLIVCVGLLHDTGMVVSDDEVEKLYLEFETRNPSFKNYSGKEKRMYLQNYVRERHGDRVSAILERPINTDTKIKSLFYVGDTKSYDLSEIIAAICRSHIESCDWIEENLDKERHYGDYEINPQQIALLLRIGDALDIDDRRAPNVLYQLLNPQGVSDEEWRKHVPITNYDKIQFDGTAFSIVFSGECSEPKIYRKILDYIDWIRKDLKDAKTLCTRFSSVYQLNISDTIEVSIKTKGFVATHLSFSLEYRQISKLLMGERIYGSKQDGLRELIQNAIDAVLLMRDIETRNPYSVYSPVIGIEIDEEAHQLVVFDNGVGMSKRILQDYFFNIGNSYYTSDEFKAGEYIYQPIGHFGIGFLACFMLSSKIRLETKHYKENEMILMEFERDSSYVTRLAGSPRYSFEHGTRIILDYDQIVPAVFHDSQSIYSYLKDLLAIGEYKILFIHNGKKEISRETLNKYDVSGGEKTTFSYSVSKYLNVRFDILNYFEDNESVYIIDDSMYEDEHFYDEGPISIAFFNEIISEIEADYQAEELTWEEALEQLPIFFYRWLYTNILDLEKAFNSVGIRALSERYLNSYIENATLTWYEIPVIFHQNTFNSFLDTLEEDGMEKASIRYNSDIHRISALCHKPLSDQMVLEIVRSYLELFSNSDDITDVSYYSVYPIPITQKTTKLLNLPGTDHYLRVISNVSIPESKVYLNGICIRTGSITLPYAIAGIEVERILLNICSGNYDTDVARSSFDAPSRERLNVKAARLIYGDVLLHAKLESFERLLIEQFMDSYYN